MSDQLVLGFMDESHHAKDEQYLRPQPPEDFKFFRWKAANGSQRCPSCKNLSVEWTGGGEQRVFSKAGSRSSLFATGSCYVCACRFWHDFGGDWYENRAFVDWHYYYAR